MKPLGFPKPTKLTLENYKIPSWNILYAGKHWSTRDDMKEEAQYSVMEALSKQKFTMYATKVNITVVGHFTRVIDCDNLCSKLVIDPLKGKLIVDDSPKYVDSVTNKSVKSDRDYTEIIISEV